MQQAKNEGPRQPEKMQTQFGHRMKDAMQTNRSMLSQSYYTDYNDTTDGLEDYLKEQKSVDLESKAIDRQNPMLDFDENIMQQIREQEIKKMLNTERQSGFIDNDKIYTGDQVISEFGLIRKIHDKKYLEYIDKQQREIYGRKKNVKE